MLALWSWTQSKRLFYMLWMLPPSWHLTQLWRLNNILQPHHFRFVSRWRCEERHSTLLLSTFTFVYTSFFFSWFEKSSKTILSLIFLFLDWWWSHQYALHHRDLHFHCKYPTWCPFFPIDSVTLNSNLKWPLDGI